MVGEKAKELFDDAQLLLQRIVDEKLFTAKCVYCRSRPTAWGMMELYTDDSRAKRWPSLLPPATGYKSDGRTGWLISSRQKSPAWRIILARLR